jgi:multicomponent Na+:H+ antiporter subunit B
MNSLILRTASRYLLPLLILFSIFLLFRGHNEPGGGFVAGLVAAAAFALYALATDVQAARYALQVDPHILIGAGLLLALVDGIVPFIYGQEFLTGRWTYLRLPFIGEIEIGSPLFFDIGVYLVVMGVVLMIIFSLAEE